MTVSSSPSIVLTAHRRSERAFVVLREWLNSATRAVLADWHDHQARRREARSFEAIGEMSAHLLRDIGAPSELISHAVADRSLSPWREVLFQLAAVAMTIVVIGTAAPTSAEATPCPMATVNAHAKEPLAGVFTGEFVGGAPVYRFPSVVVIGSRLAEPAKSEPPLAQQRRPAKSPAVRRAA